MASGTSSCRWDCVVFVVTACVCPCTCVRVCGVLGTELAVRGLDVLHKQKPSLGVLQDLEVLASLTGMWFAHTCTGIWFTGVWGRLLP